MKKVFAFIAAGVLLFSCNEQKTEQPQQQVQRLFSGRLPQKIEIPKNADGGWYFINGNFPAQAGDTVLMEGEYAYINIKKMDWSARRVVFMQKPGAAAAWAGTNGNYAWVMEDCKGFEIIGVRMGAKAGKFNDASFNFHGSDNFSMRDCEIFNSKLGVFSNRSVGHYNNITFDGNWFHHITDAQRSNFSEAMYIGPTNGTDTLATSFRNLRITNNRYDSIGGDAIQLANCINVYVAGNTINVWGFHKIPNQFSGLLNGGLSSGTWENNYLKGGYGCPFNVINSTGQVVFRGNVADSCALLPGQDGFYIRGKNLSVKLYKNSINKVARNFVTDETKSITDSSGNRFGSPVKPPVVVPPANNQRKPVLILYSDSTWSVA